MPAGRRPLCWAARRPCQAPVPQNPRDPSPGPVARSLSPAASEGQDPTVTSGRAHGPGRGPAGSRWKAGSGAVSAPPCQAAQGPALLTDTKGLPQKTASVSRSRKQPAGPERSSVTISLPLGTEQAFVCYRGSHQIFTGAHGPFQAGRQGAKCWASRTHRGAGDRAAAPSPGPKVPTAVWSSLAAHGAQGRPGSASCPRLGLQGSQKQ